jgi:hypothetical protein
MAIFCFSYGTFIYGYGDDGSRVMADPVVFSLGMICIALFCTAATTAVQIKKYSIKRSSLYAPDSDAIQGI